MKKRQLDTFGLPEPLAEGATPAVAPRINPQLQGPIPTSAPDSALFSPISSVICLAAVLIAFIGQDLLRGTDLLGATATFADPVNAGILLSLLAAAMFGCAAPKLPRICLAAPLKMATTVRPFSWQRLLPTLVVSAVITISAALLFASNHRYLLTWGTPTPEGTLEWYLSWLAFAVGVALLAWLQRGAPSGEASPSFTRQTAAVFAGIVALALGIRCYDLIDTPHTVNMDNAIAMLSAYQYMSPGSWLRPGLGEHGAAAIGFSFFSMASWLLGPGILANRLPEALIGTGMVAAGYLFVWRAFDSHRLAALTALVMATYAPLVHFSRHVMNIDPWAFSLLGFVCLIHGMRSHRLWAMASAGFLIGFSLQLYISIRSLIFTAPFIIAYLTSHRPHSISKLLMGWLLFSFGFLVSFGANLSDLFVNHIGWVVSNRPGSSFIDIDTLRQTMAAEHQQYLPAFALLQLKRTFLMFQATTDMSAQMRGSEALFSPFIAPFGWLGLGVVCASWARNPGAAILLLVAAINIALGQLMWGNIPYWPKLIIVMFAGCFCIALALQRTCDAGTALAAASLKPLGAFPQRVTSILGPVLLTVALGVVLVSVVIDLGRYFTVAPIPSSAPEVAGRYIMNLPENVMVCSRFQLHDIYVDKVELQFYGYGRKMKDFHDTPITDASSMCGPRPFVWLITPDQTDLRDKLKALYPGGTIEDHPFSDGSNIFWSYYVP